MFKTYYFKLLNLIERRAAYAQGKGFGTSTTELEVHLIMSLLGSQPRVAIDVGGNLGDYAAALRKRNPLLEIHVFEPSLTNLAKLGARFKDDALVKLVHFALSSKCEKATLFSDYPGSGLSSLVRRRLDHFDIPFDYEERVDTTRFEVYWEKVLDRKSIDLVKIDIEGYELDALQGFGQAIFSTKAIQFEFGGCNIDTRTYFQDFWYYFKEHDFKIYRITPIGYQLLNRYVESDEFFMTTNFIAINNR
jgi:FkbM family methyltransferase